MGGGRVTVRGAQWILLDTGNQTCVSFLLDECSTNCTIVPVPLENLILKHYRHLQNSPMTVGRNKDFYWNPHCSLSLLWEILAWYNAEELSSQSQGLGTTWGPGRELDAICSLFISLLHEWRNLYLISMLFAPNALTVARRVLISTSSTRNKTLSRSGHYSIYSERKHNRHIRKQCIFWVKPLQAKE